MERSARGFTLIEFMVVLSILALIAVLGYSYFGVLIHEARLSSEATKVHNSLLALVANSQEYIRRNGQPVPGAHLDSYDGGMFDYLELKALSSEPADEYQDFTGGRTAETKDYSFDNNTESMDSANGASTDELFNFAIVTDDLCSKYNEMFAPAVGAAWKWPTTNPERGPLEADRLLTWCANMRGPTRTSSS